MSLTLVEGPRMTGPDLWLGFPEIMSQVGLPGLLRIWRREGGLMVEVVGRSTTAGLCEYGRDAYLAGKERRRVSGS